MTVQTIKAVYRNGVFKPLQPITLPDNARVEIRISSQAEAPEGPVDLGPLAGAFPELAVLSEDDLDWANLAPEPDAGVSGNLHTFSDLKGIWSGIDLSREDIQASEYRLPENLL